MRPSPLLEHLARAVQTCISDYLITTPQNGFQTRQIDIDISIDVRHPDCPNACPCCVRYDMISIHSIPSMPLTNQKIRNFSTSLPIIQNNNRKIKKKIIMLNSPLFSCMHFATMSTKAIDRNSMVICKKVPKLISIGRDNDPVGTFWLWLVGWAYCSPRPGGCG